MQKWSDYGSTFLILGVSVIAQILDWLCEIVLTTALVFLRNALVGFVQGYLLALISVMLLRNNLLSVPPEVNLFLIGNVLGLLLTLLRCCQTIPTSHYHLHQPTMTERENVSSNE